MIDATKSRAYNKTYTEVLAGDTDEADSFMDWLQDGGYKLTGDGCLWKDTEGCYWEYSELVDELYADWYFEKGNK